jgi:aryl-alcohol dehydrogenase-like predicted oxidoreductase
LGIRSTKSIAAGQSRKFKKKDDIMQMRKLGESGLFVSELCFGAMTFGGTDGLWGKVGRLDQEDADALVKAALEAGINLFDTANVYADAAKKYWDVH